MYNDTNLFCTLTFDYFDLLSEIDKNHKIYDGKGIRDSLHKKHLAIPTNNSLKTMYDVAITNGILDNSANLDNWLMKVKDFTSFIRIAEKCFMYRNDDDNTIFADIDDKNNTSVLYINDKERNVKYRISFQDTYIDIIGKKANNSILDYVNGDDTSCDNTALIIQIDIIRKYGKEMLNHFKFIHTSSIPTIDYSDTVLLKVAKAEISRLIFNTYENIVNINVADIVGQEKIKMKDVLNNDVWIWR